MLSRDKSATLERAYSHVRRDVLAEAVSSLVDTASPTGEEAALARAIAARLTDRGLSGEVQSLDALQANAVGHLKGDASGPSLLLYAPIDTVLAGKDREDLPWASAEPRSDLRAHATRDGDYITGLGAHNPKGHAACVLVAAEAIARAKVPLRGDLLLGFGAGGMPTEARQGTREHCGHGAGCEFMLRERRPDYAVIAKSGWSVSWEEVGFCWFEVRVQGTHTYVGSRHLMPYSNAIHNAARLIDRLEAWFPTWAEEHRSGLVAPQAVVSYVEGGWRRMPAFTPAMCRFLLDLRISPRTSAMQAQLRFGRLLKELASELGIDIEWECVRAIPGTTTSPDNWIIRSAVAGWEFLEQRAHRPTPGLSGATDANILRSAGVPTARIGLPKVDLPGLDFELGMNAVKLADMEKLTKHLIYVAIDTCTRTSEQANG